MLKLLIALITLACASLCEAQGCGGELSGAQIMDSEHYRLAYRAQPAKIAIGRSFSVEFVVCAKDRAPAQRVTVDAYMPEHAHGMNYRATVVPVPSAQSGGSARFLAEGLMLHMPGRWDLIFDVESSGGTERFIRSIVLE